MIVATKGGSLTLTAWCIGDDLRGVTYFYFSAWQGQTHLAQDDVHGSTLAVSAQYDLILSK